jgi:CheY-like chemotaxis protein
MVTGGYAQELASRCTREDDRFAAAQILSATERGEALTRQLLAVSRPVSGRRRAANLNEIVANVKSMLSRMIGDNIVLGLDLDSELLPVSVDPGHIEQILVNLAVNSRDAMPAGGMLQVRTRSAPGRSLIEVSDTGIGLDHETRERMFEAFFTTKPRGEGTGLGLAIVYSLVKGMDGSIRVESAPGQGTTFVIELPTAEGDTIDGAPRRQRETLPGGSETILVVEDRDSVRILLTRTLKKAGYTVLEASNGEEGLNVALNYRHEIHLVLTDVVMPHMGGPEMALRLQAVRPKTRFLFLSGHPDPGGVHDDDVPPSRLVAKPILPSDLCNRVRNELDDRLKEISARSAVGAVRTLLIGTSRAP